MPKNASFVRFLKNVEISFLILKYINLNIIYKNRIYKHFMYQLISPQTIFQYFGDDDKEMLQE